MRASGLLLLLTACAEGGAGLDQTKPFEQPPMSASLSYRTNVGGAPACDLQVELLGTAIDYVGSCDGCDLRFSLTSTLAADDSPGACTPDPLLSMLGDDEHGGLVLWYQDVLATSSYYYGTTNPDVLWLGYHLYREGEDPAEAHYLEIGAVEDPTVPGSVSWSGSVLSWLWYQNLDEPVYLDTYTPECGKGAPYTEPVDPSAVCWGFRDWEGDQRSGDLWTFEAGAAEAPISFGIEVMDGGEFAAVMRVIGPDGCLVAEVRDNVHCEQADPGLVEGCPAFQAAADVAGTWTVIVLMDGPPASTAPGYLIWTSTDAPPALMAGGFTAWDQPHDNTVEASMFATFAAP